MIKKYNDITMQIINDDELIKDTLDIHHGLNIPVYIGFDDAGRFFLFRGVNLENNNDTILDYISYCIHLGYLTDGVKLVPEFPNQFWIDQPDLSARDQDRLNKLSERFNICIWNRWWFRNYRG